MANLKELLGDKYKEGMTVDEAEQALANIKLADISAGAYVSKDKYLDIGQAIQRVAEKAYDRRGIAKTARRDNAKNLSEKCKIKLLDMNLKIVS